MTKQAMSERCRVEVAAVEVLGPCPECRRPGQKVERITAKALLRSEALARLSASEHRFCATPSCPIVYFGRDDVFGREDVRVPVFEKEAAGERTVCYCFAVAEGDIRREIERSGRSTASERITALVKADRCACEVRNPRGACCLGNVVALERAQEDRARAREGEGSPTVSRSIEGGNRCG